jgi:MFS family permease
VGEREFYVMATVTPPQRRLPRAIVVLGLVSFCNDLASDIVIPLVPVLLATVLAAGPVALGAIEGVADAVASLLKLWAGRRSDLLGGRRKTLVVAGYAISNVARPLLALAGGWGTVLALRAADRVGKGIRSAPRDAMIGDLAPPGRSGAAFGLQRALDNAGALLGALVAAAALAWLDTGIAAIILASAIPGALAVALLAFGVRDVPHAVPPRAAVPLAWSRLSPVTRRYLAVIGVFTFARTSETFVVLRGHGLGLGAAELLVLWAAMQAAKIASAYAGGTLSDRRGRRPVMLASWALLAPAFIALAWADTRVSLWGAALALGLVAGLAEGAERALIDDLAAPGERGTAFGWYYLVSGIAAIPAGLTFGLLWAGFGPGAAYGYAAALAALSAALLASPAFAARRTG